MEHEPCRVVNAPFPLPIRVHRFPLTPDDCSFAIRHSPLPTTAHCLISRTRLPLRGVPRSCDGDAGASRQPWGRLSSGPGRPGRACLGALSEPPGTLWVPWVASRRPRDGDFCPATLFGLPLAPLRTERLPSSHLAAAGFPPL